MKGNFVTKIPSPSDDAQRTRLLGRLKDWIDQGRQTRLIVAGASPPPPGVTHPNRARIFIMLSGARHVRIAGPDGPMEVRLCRGDILFCPRESWHQVLPNHSYALLNIIFAPGHTSLSWKTGRPRLTLNYVAPPCITDSTRHIIQALETLDADAPEGATLANTLISLAYRDLEQAGCLTDRARATHLRIRDYMEENYRSPINRDTVAQAFDLHPNHISRLFKQHEGHTFSHALSTLRLEEAARLLRSTTLSIKHIATQCGFESSNYFGKVFRRNFVMSPGEFRDS